MITVGVTGSIGMGKTFVGRIFQDLGIPVHCSDQAVHRAYAQGGSGVGPVGAVFPDAIIDGAVDRARLAALVIDDADKKRQLEEIVHPLVWADQARFRADAQAAGHDIIVYDIPLLFEVGADRRVDLTICVSAPEDVQRKRVLTRPGMSEDTLQKILSVQMPDAEKKRRADYVIDNSGMPEQTRAQVEDILAKIRAR